MITVNVIFFCIFFYRTVLDLCYTSYILDIVADPLKTVYCITLEILELI